MPVPVANWKKTSGKVQLFHDLLEPELLHYGPNVAWGTLMKQDLGQKFTIFRGEVDFSYTAEQLDALQATFPDSRMAPLIAEDIANSVTPSIPIAAPHSFKLSLIPSIPFPKLSFNLTVSHDDSQYQALIDQVEAKWAANTIFTGSVEFKHSMRRVACAYTAILPTAEVAKELRNALTGSKWPPAQLGQEVSGVVQRNKAKWVQSSVPTGFSGGCENEVLAFVAGRVVTSFFRLSEPLITFDNGEKVDALEMVDSSTLVPKQSWTLNKSSESSEIIRVLGA